MGIGYVENLAPMRILSIIAGLMLLTGCEVASTAMLAKASTVAFASTDRFLSDHILSMATGEDCSLGNALDDGHACRPHYVAPEAVPIYCYPTIGAVTCYQQPHPTDRSALPQR